jgi:hypothetical protein
MVFKGVIAEAVEAMYLDYDMTWLLRKLLSNKEKKTF